MAYLQYCVVIWKIFLTWNYFAFFPVFELLFASRPPSFLSASLLPFVFVSGSEKRMIAQSDI
jgi:hypothetical protein